MKHQPKLNNIIFSYGSNMCEKELTKYNNKLTTPDKIHFNLLDIGILRNYKFVYKNICEKTMYAKIKSAKATITPSKNKKVYGTVIEMSDELFKIIVKKEGLHKNIYRIETHSIQSLVSDKTYKSNVFIMNEELSPPINKCKSTISKNPSIAYETKIVNAAKFYNFPSNYINKYLLSNR
jgi:hypothetical protein